MANQSVYAVFDNCRTLEPEGNASCFGEFCKSQKNSCRCRYRNYRKDVQSNYAFRKQFATGSFLRMRKRQSLQRNTRCEENVRCQKRSSHKREMP